MSLLSVKDVGKAFRSYGSEWQRFARWFGLPAKASEEHWVLRHINFDIQPGEAVGIIGQNGAGKSTLLKIIAGTLQPSEGQVHVSGRIAAILELGMGFNPELTGRQNAYHGLGLMGFTHSEIERVMPELETFSDIGEYFDQPVRTYSSGMQMRVAFSVATVYRPELLIVDEALSVGDAAFQRKSFRHIESCRNAGMALLLVSHDIESIKKMCSKALFVENGLQKIYANAKLVCDEYEKHLFGNLSNENLKESERESSKFDPSLVTSCKMSYGNGNALIQDVRIEDKYGNRINVVESGEKIYLVFDILTQEHAVNKVFINMQVKTTDGVVVYGVNSQHLESQLAPIKKHKKNRVKFSLKNHLAPGSYFFSCGVKELNTNEFCCRIVDAVILRVVDRQHSTVARGVLDMQANLDLWMARE